jgi:DNA invertase Pin-like site-specific DNA recombinase
VVYARVSSKEQEKEGFSIPAQLKLLRDYAPTEGIRVVEEYVDVETAKQAGRSSFGEMVDYLRKHPEARIILVEKTDRLYRNLKDWVTLDELDLEIHFVKENVVLSPNARSSEKFRDFGTSQSPKPTHPGHRPYAKASQASCRLRRCFPR